MKTVMIEIYEKLKELEEKDLEKIKEKVSLLATEKRELERLTSVSLEFWDSNGSISLIDLPFSELGDET